MKILGFNFGGSKSRSLPPLPADVAQAAAVKLMSMGFSVGPDGKMRSGMQDQADQMNRAYDAAITTPYNAGFRSTFGSSDAEILSSLYPARGRSRTLCKDTPHGKNIIRQYGLNVIGHRSFRLKMRYGKTDKSGKFTPDKDLNAEIEKLYYVSGLPKNFAVNGRQSRMAAFKIMVASAVRDGFIFLRFHDSFPHNKFGMGCELLEGDRLYWNHCGKSERGNEIRMGVEIDKWRRQLSYELFTRHPGDPFGTVNPLDPNKWVETVPAREIILYSNMADRAEQTIGFPELDSIIQPLYRKTQYTTAMALAAIASCCKPWWIKKLFPTGMTFTADEMNNWVGAVASAMQSGNQGVVGSGPTSGTIQRQEGVSARTSTDVPASMREMNYGEELMVTDVNFPDNDAPAFNRDTFHEVSAGAGLSYPLLTGDFQNLGFSATRAMALPSQDNFKMWQQDFIDMVVSEEFERRIQAAIMMGLCSAKMDQLEDICLAARFMGVRWPFVNPLQDVQATILQLERGLVTEQQVQDEMVDGMTIEDLYAIRAEEIAMQKDYGLDDVDSQVTKPTVKTGEVDEVLPNPTGGAQPPAKTKVHNPVRRSVRVDDTVMRMIELAGDGKNGHGH